MPQSTEIRTINLNRGELFYKQLSLIAEEHQIAVGEVVLLVDGEIHQLIRHIAHGMFSFPQMDKLRASNSPTPARD